MFSCKENMSPSPVQIRDEIVVVSVEEALQTLDSFLSDNNLVQTKSGQNRTYSNVSTYYRRGVLTKSGADTTFDNIPAAYVVNFDNNAGFAVLGANNIVPDIVAVTEFGAIDPVTLEVVDNSGFVDSYSAMFEDMDESEINNFRESVVVTADSLLYSPEDDDYYVGMNNTGNISNVMIHQCFESSYNDFLIKGGVGGSLGANYTVKDPLLTYSWDQIPFYNNYCKRGRNNQKQAAIGCSTTAMAMIVAFNEYPSLKLNGVDIDYKNIKNNANLSDTTTQNQIALLMGSIYNFVKKTTSKKYTLITPKQIAKRMNEFGYANVDKVNESSLTTSMISKISCMLGENKPVFISAIPKGVKNWNSGHSWVVDGAKFSGKNAYLLHMNFGWSACSNGYYATNCLNPSKPEEPDGEIAKTDDYVFSWHFRIITYDTPDSDKQLIIDYTY